MHHFKPPKHRLGLYFPRVFSKKHLVFNFLCPFSSSAFLPPATVLARLAVFPVIVKGQREAAKLNNVLPEMTKLTNRMNEAKQSGNKFECKCSLLFLHGLILTLQMFSWSWATAAVSGSVTVSKAYSDLNLFQKKHDVNPLRGFLIPLVQVSYSQLYVLLAWMFQVD